VQPPEGDPSKRIQEGSLGDTPGRPQKGSPCRVPQDGSSQGVPGRGPYEWSPVGVHRRARRRGAKEGFPGVVYRVPERGFPGGPQGGSPGGDPRCASCLQEGSP
jgi:hypothetical protein